MRTTNSITALGRIRRAFARCYLQAMLSGILLPSLASVCCAQMPQPPIVLQSQGTGTAIGRLNSTQGASGTAQTLGGLTDQPIFPGETVHVSVFEAPDFSTEMQVSEGGDIAIPVVGSVHVEGLNSLKAERLIEAQLKGLRLVLDPHVTVTVDNPDTGITVLGEVHTPGIYQPTGKHTLSDLIAAAGGMTADTGRVVEISNDRDPQKKVDLAWDPTMHSMADYEYPIHAGDRVFVKPCGVAYIGGHVAKPGAYSICGSPTMTLSRLIAIAGGETPFAALKHTYLVRTQSDGIRVVQLIDLYRVLRSKVPDPVIREDDIVYVSPSPLKQALNTAVSWAGGIAPALLYVYQP